MCICGLLLVGITISQEAVRWRKVSPDAGLGSRTGDFAILIRVVLRKGEI